MKSNKLNNILYSIAYFLLSTLTVIGSSRLIFINEFFKLTIYAVIVVIFLYIFYKSNLGLKKTILCFILGIISIFAYLKLGVVFLAINILALFSLKTIDLKKIVQIDLIVKVIFLLIHLLFFCKDIIFDNYLLDTLLYKGEYIRYSLYFSHPNLASSLVFWLVIDMFYLKKKNSIIDYIVYTIIIFLTFAITKTRTLILVYGAFLFIIFAKVFIKENIFDKLINILYKYIFEIFALFSIIPCLTYSNQFVHSFLNSITSGRIYHSYTAFNMAGFQLFPCDKLLNVNKLIIDNFYIRCITIYGAIYLILLFFSTKNKNISKSIQKDKIIVITFAFYLFSEYNSIILGNAIPLLLIGKSIYSTKNQVTTDANELIYINQSKKLSIIVPIYNMEKYLKKCINSILEQTYKNLELILIDDGSTDKSAEICDHFSKIDDRVICKYIKNSGVSSARNTGLELATGDYIGFVDPDDCIDKNMYSILIKNLEKTDSHISVCGYYQVTENGKLKFQTISGEKNCVDSMSCIKEILNEAKYSSCCWNKIYKKELFENLRFNKKLKIGEDLELIFKLLLQNLKVVYDSTPLYYWLIRNNSVTHNDFSKNLKKWDDEVKLCEKILNFCKNKNLEILEYAIKRYLRVNMFCYKNCLIEKVDINIQNKYRNEILKYYKECLKFDFVDLKFKIKLLIFIYCPKFILFYNSIKLKK